MEPFTLMIHGGAGTVPNPHDYDASLEAILKEGQALLAQGTAAIDVVERCVCMLEDDAHFNAGKGSVLTAERTVEMDAAIMNGADMKAGSVAGVVGVKNPIALARLVMDRTEHVMLTGSGAMHFAEEMHVPIESLDYFLTERRVKQLEEAKQQSKVVLDHSDMTPDGVEKKFGTVGAVARDIHGSLAAATSTGGITNKKYGRVGDSPIIGAGVYAENATCAVSATGYGEQFIRTVLSKTVADIVRFKGASAEEAAREAIAYLVATVKGIGGVIVIDSAGRPASAMSSQNMIHGSATRDEITILT
jgi:beta-aspartyl-peptidase (threonine type)